MNWLYNFGHSVAVLLGSERYSQHAICLTNDPVMMMLYVAGDLSTWVAYTAIGLTIIMKRVHLIKMSPGALLLYGSFILICGQSHLTKTLTLFLGVYRLDVVLTCLMAAVSLTTAALTLAAVFGNDPEDPKRGV